MAAGKRNLVGGLARKKREAQAPLYFVLLRVSRCEHGGES
jgi:hypothetical protein